MLSDPAPFRTSSIALNTNGSWFASPPIRVAPGAQLRWMARVRGEGAILAENAADGIVIGRELVDIQADDWEWVVIPVENFDRFAPLTLKVEQESGSIDCDRILLANGEFSTPGAGMTIDLPAPGMFHAGYTSLEDDTVVLEQGREPNALIFYGPKLPLEKGRYRVELIFSSRAPKGTLLGQFNIKRHDRDHILNWIPVMAGARSLAEFSQTQNLPMHIEFRFLGSGSLKIHCIRLTRIE